MAIGSKYASKKKDVKQNDNEVTLKFTKSELEALFISLGETSFKGNQVELIYSLAVKLQMGLNKLNKE